MPEDVKLERIDFIPQPILARLGNLEIRTIRQLFARLGNESDELGNYLGLSEEEFADFCRNVKEFIKDRFPEDALPRINPTVNKRGVAVHRMNDSSRPRFFGRK